ncbi:hypothetical protein Ct9H90mP12_3250 [bacterium]|nr:MAG: hypothetical protein Ct9H90mP12_3250 [bacterium]
MDKKFTTDGVHLNDRGYDNWAKFIEKYVTSKKGPWTLIMYKIMHDYFLFIHLNVYSIDQ